MIIQCNFTLIELIILGESKKILGVSKILGASKNNGRVQGAEGAYEYWARKARENCQARIGRVRRVKISGA